MDRPWRYRAIGFVALACLILAGPVAARSCFAAPPGDGDFDNDQSIYYITDLQEPDETLPDETPPDETLPDESQPDATTPPTTGDEGLIEQPTAVAAPPPAPISSLLSQLEGISVAREAELGGATAANIVSGDEVTFLGATDTGDLLSNSVFNTGVYASQVSPVITNARVRGYRYSQIRTTLDGAAWFPVRPDADTPLSRFDSNIVEDVAVIRGPYNVRFGPGFSFIDVSLRGTPRYESGFRSQALSKFTFDTNGEQWYGRQSLQGGNGDRGWRIGYAQRGGSDYTAGDGRLLASSYNVGDLDCAYGLDLSDTSSLEFTYIRTQMDNIETPGQVNDFDNLISNGYSLRYLAEDRPYFDRFSMQGWYNLSDFTGTSRNKTTDPTNPEFFFPPADPRFPARFARVTTFGDTSSAGLRAMMSWGDEEFRMLTLGADGTFLRQTYLEQRDFNGVIDFGLPKSRQNDAGLFMDHRRVLTDQLTIKSGARIDFVHGTSEPTATVDARSLALNSGQGLPQSFTLGAGYFSTDYKLDDGPVGEGQSYEGLTVSSGVGYGERAPSLTDLYADLPHLSIMQEGAFFVPHGDLTLKKEKALQTDLSLTMQSDPFRGGISVFYAHVGDFITYNAPHLPPPSGPHEQHAIGVNRDAQFVGGEAFGNLKISDPLSVFAALSYVQGKDLDRDEPMWGVPPLDTRMGLRLVDAGSQRWGAEYILRIVDNQDRLSTVGFVGELPTAGFQTHSMRGFYQLSEAVAFVTGVENLGDVFYREHLDTRLDLTAGAIPSRGIVRRGRSFYFALQAVY